ncbi:MAG: M23 family metallopeptidase [Acidobacteria bacterium]|nr:M23 family metallopeptidase [Acidobacteriota bacterium]
MLAVAPIGVAAAAAATAHATPKRPVIARLVSAPKVIAPTLRVEAAQASPAPPPLNPHDPNAFVDPLDDFHVISPYGFRSGRRHEGIDIKAAYHSPVHASFAGTVLQAGPGLSGYGNTVTLDHGDGVTTLYAHLAAWTVKRGDEVAPGDVIGAEGQTGNATTYHVHYEVREDGVPRDPAPYLSGE